MRVTLNLELHNFDGTVDRRRDVAVTIVQGLFELDGPRYRTTPETLVEQAPDGSQTSWVICHERPSRLSNLAQRPKRPKP